MAARASPHHGRSALPGTFVPWLPAPFVIARPRVLGQLAAAAQRRVTALTAGPGFGKTTALASWSVHRRCAWYALTPTDRDAAALARGLLASLGLRVPGLLEGLGLALDGSRGPDGLPVDLVNAFVPTLAGALQHRLSADLVLILDDLHELDGHDEPVRLVADLCHMAPSRLHVVIASRSGLPFPAQRLRLHGQLHVLAADALGFDRDETAALLGAVGGPALREHAAAVVSMTAGWPAATRLVAEALASAVDAGQVVAGLMRRGGATSLVCDLLDAETSGAPSDVLTLLRVGAALDDFSAALLDGLGVPNAADILDEARRRGIHISPAPRDGWFTLSPMSREYALTRLVAGPGDLAVTWRRAARWHREHDDPASALRYLCRAGDDDALVDLLTGHGTALLTAGQAGAVQEALAGIAPARRTAAIELLDGEARYLRGEWDRATECLTRLVPADGAVPAAAAWRLGLIQHMRGEPAGALSMYRRGYADPDGSDRDRSLAAAWGAAAAWLIGDVAACRDLADKAEALAARADDGQALAAAHTARAMLAALDGDRRGNAMHYRRALDHAERAGDALQVIRIRTNRGSLFLEEGYYAEAVAELDTAIGLADLAGFAAMRALALRNRGEAVRRLGRLEDAARDCHTALAEQQRLDSRMASYPLTGLGLVHADQGNFSLAQAAFEEAVALAEPSGDLQGLVPALCGLARAVLAADPAAAAQLSARALSSAANLADTQAQLCAGWVALHREDAAAAYALAKLANDTARHRRDRAGMAESLELRAAATADPDERLALLREAEAMWEALRCPLPLARTQLALIRAGGAQAAGRPIADIERDCRERGARALAAEAARERAGRDGTPQLTVRTLGGFQVLREGVPVPHRAWQSRKARDLLKILVTRRGLPVTRDVLCDLLWTAVDLARASARLSVAISTLRSVLDPHRSLPADHYVASEEGRVWLRRDRMDIDVDAFLHQAEAALAGDIAALSAAEAQYPGDFCEEDRYADWAQPLREEARSAYVAVVRALARHQRASGEHENAVRCLMRLLACEPYDEQAYLDLVRELDAAGRHGDARRMYRAYTTRMGELAVEPSPYPDRIEPAGTSA
jgi:DNA-binding SARP family transcriptional activator